MIKFLVGCIEIDVDPDKMIGMAQKQTERYLSQVKKKLHKEDYVNESNRTVW